MGKCFQSMPRRAAACCLESSSSLEEVEGIGTSAPVRAPILMASEACPSVSSSSFPPSRPNQPTL